MAHFIGIIPRLDIFLVSQRIHAIENLQYALRQSTGRTDSETILNILATTTYGTDSIAAHPGTAEVYVHNFCV